MNLYEYQGKRLLENYGIRIPRGEIAVTPEQAEEAAGAIGGDQWMVKAQILSGGRGQGHFKGNELGGGVQKADSTTSLRRFASAMLNQPLVTQQTGPEGALVERLYVEQAMEVDNEYSMAMLVDARFRQLVLLYSDQGGSDIEAVAANDPASIHKLVIDFDQGMSDEQGKTLSSDLNLEGALADEFRKVIGSMHKLYIERDASLVEINPLATVGDELVALDAKISLDDNALFRQKENRHLEEDQVRADGRLQASRDGFNYFQMDGNIGCLAVGAGLSMATIDALKYFGGNPANFLDLPPDSKVSRTQAAIEMVLANPALKCLLINVFGGGIMRCDTIADAILLVNQTSPIKVPMVVRLAGTNVNLAVRRLHESMPGIVLPKNMAEAAEKAVEFASATPVDKATQVAHQPLGDRLKGLISSVTGSRSSNRGDE